MERQHLRRIRPFVDGAALLAAFFAYGRPNHDRCPRPVLTVPPLPIMSFPDKSEVVVKRGTRASGGEISRGLFVFPSAISGECLPQRSGPTNRC